MVKQRADIGFNPRTHMGCDLRLTLAILRRSVFQSTHPHGVRRWQVERK